MQEAHNNQDLADWMHHYVSRHTPQLVVVHMPRGQLLIPRVQSKVENGKFVPVPVDDMFPYLGREELAAVRECV